MYDIDQWVLRINKVNSIWVGGEKETFKERLFACIGLIFVCYVSNFLYFSNRVRLDDSHFRN